ncbi:MAG TPA: YezD family protein [Firmicutes bacterium]|nr:YezD family protein [Bacillota bacterium]
MLERRQETNTRVQNSTPEMDQVLQRVRRALEGLEYGEVVLKVQGGRVIWVDRYERERVG